MPTFQKRRTMQNNSESPRLSIVMPVFNHTDMVSVMVQSIISSTFTDWELLAIDDGSGEETLSTLQDFASTDHRIKLIQRDRLPKGAQTCRNIGLDMANGEFIIFFDSDDFVTEDCLMERVNHLAKRQDFDFMVFPSATMQNNVFDESATLFAYGYDIYKDDMKAFAQRTLPFVVWNNIYRTKSIRNNGIHWDEGLLSLQDAQFNIECILCGMKYGYANIKPHFGYRIDANSGSVSKKIMSKEHQDSHIHAIDNFYSAIQARYGHKYDKALYNGCLVIYNRIFNEGVDFEFADKIISLAKQYSPKYGYLLGFQIAATKLLTKFMSAKRARQIPMLTFLIRAYWHKFHTKPGLINKIRKDEKSFNSNSNI